MAKAKTLKVNNLRWLLGMILSLDPDMKKPSSVFEPYDDITNAGAGGGGVAGT
jgi:hypothetical protein